MSLDLNIFVFPSAIKNTLNRNLTLNCSIFWAESSILGAVSDCGVVAGVLSVVTVGEGISDV